jgi:hypothetical protein
LINYKSYLAWSNFPGTAIPDPRTIVVNVSKAIYYLKVCACVRVCVCQCFF